MLFVHPLTIPRVSHAYAEAGLVYQLVVMQNKMNLSDNLISRRIHDANYSLVSFNQLLINEMLDNYSYECLLVICHTCVAHNLYLCYVYYLCIRHIKAVSLYLLLLCYY